MTPATPPALRSATPCGRSPCNAVSLLAAIPRPLATYARPSPRRPELALSVDAGCNCQSEVTEAAWNPPPFRTAHQDCAPGLAQRPLRYRPVRYWAIIVTVRIAGIVDRFQIAASPSRGTSASPTPKACRQSARAGAEQPPFGAPLLGMQAIPIASVQPVPKGRKRKMAKSGAATP